MTVRGLYQKWRPQRFADVVGQSPVVQTLRQAVGQGRVGHAYLFAGPRGTGKTSTARILAKALNCRSQAPGASPAQDEAAHGEPDNTCPFCQAVNEGRALDMVEVDAASHRGIDDVRGLRERVFGSGPAEGRCKVYIIDEAHMLTEPAFNALLKTLEEPAPWAYFILCTTEAHKLPATIISRCQRFDFHRITAGDVVARLETICRGEGVQAEPEALRAIARAAWGSLRDACNVLEQGIVSAGSPVTLATVEELLGLSRDVKALQLVRHALSGDVAQGLVAINEASAAGADLRTFHRDTVEFLRALLLLKSKASEALDYPVEVLKELQAMAGEVPWQSLFRALKLFGEVNLRATEAPSTLPLELALVECVAAAQETRQRVRPVGEPAPRPPVRQGSPGPPPPRAPSPPRSVRPEIPKTPAQDPRAGLIPGGAGGNPGTPATPEPPRRWAGNPPGPAAPLSPAAQTSSPAGATFGATKDGPRQEAKPPLRPGSLTDPQWESICKALKRVKGNKFVLGSLLLDCREHYIEGDSLVLLFRTGANRDRLREELEYPPNQRTLQEAVQATLGRAYTLRLEVGEGPEPQNQPAGHLVRAAMAMGAKIVETKGEAP